MQDKPDDYKIPNRIQPYPELEGVYWLNVHMKRMITMNYEKEINAFYDCIERNPLSASAGALWFALMHINSKTMWEATFTVPAPVLRLKAGLPVSSFKRARTELKEKGFIDYQSRDKNQAAVYRMFSLVLDGNKQVEWDEEHNMNQEVIPEWFKEQKRKKKLKLKRDQKQAEMELLDPEAEYAEVERMLAAYKRGRDIS